MTDDEREERRRRLERSRFEASSHGPIGRPFSESEVREHFRNVAQPIEALETPLESWNEVCNDDGGGVGIAREWLVLIGGPPGAGKTLLAMNVASGAMRSGQSVGFVKLEMSDQQIRSRFYAIVTGRRAKMFQKRPGRQQDIAPEAKQSIRDAWDDLPDEADLLYNRFTLRQKDDALREMAHWALDKGVETFVVDFVQRIRTEGSDLRRRFQEIAGDLADLAEQLRIRVIGVSQLKNSAADEIMQGERSPTQHDLYGGMAVAQEANQTIMLDHSEYTRPVPGMGSRYAHTIASVVKNKHGDSPDIPIEWDYQCLRVRERRPDELEG